MKSSNASVKYDPWKDPKNAGKPIRYESDEEAFPKSFLIRGVLYHKPIEPVEPTKTKITLKATNVTCHSGETIEDILRKLPPGTPLRDIKFKVMDEALLTFEKREETENIFYEEEMKVYVIEQLAYEAAMKLWAKKVAYFKNVEISDLSHDFDAALAEKAIKGLHKKNSYEDEIARSWLESLDIDEQAKKDAAKAHSDQMTKFGEKIRSSIRDGKPLFPEILSSIEDDKNQ